MKVLRISASDTYHIRHKVLAPGLTLDAIKFPNDDDDDLSFHLGAFIDGHLVSVASFFYEKHPNFSDLHQYQLRGMATLPEYEKKGLSSELLKVAFPIIRQNFCTLLWCNARKSAVGFYEKVGFLKNDEPEFEIDHIGAHFLMYKKLTDIF